MTTDPQPHRGPPPPAPIRVVGKALTWLIARAPVLWPLLRGSTRRFFDRAATGWDDRVRPDSGEHLGPLVAALDELTISPRRALDIGTGTGAGALLLADRYPEADVVGVDISPAMIEAAHAKLDDERSRRVRFDVADAAELPYPDGHFDLIVQLNVPAFFDQIARLLADGGHVVFVSSLGTATPFHTAHATLRRGLARRRIRTLSTGRAGTGMYLTARRDPH